MPCYSPLHAYEGELQENGKVATVWRRSDSPEHVKRDLPCYQCVGCRLERSRQWAMRCMDEASLYERNCFITLTFDDEHLPANRSLDVSYFQNFMKRLRKRYGSGIRFYHAGEYGSKLGRPHYHSLLFNHDFDDRVLLTVRNGNRLDTSDALCSLWPFGYSSVGSVTFESAAYVARYVMKKVTGDKATDHYIDKFSGEVLKPEYTTMSRRPGIGSKWFDKFRDDVFPSDEKVVNGSVFRPPRFYDNLLDKVDPEMFESVKLKRMDERKFVDDSRLMVKQEVKLAQIKSLKRGL